jgi:hypothetical protein
MKDDRFMNKRSKNGWIFGIFTKRGKDSKEGDETISMLEFQKAHETDPSILCP